MPEVEEEEELSPEADVPMGFVDLILRVLVHVFCGVDGFKVLFTRHYFAGNHAKPS